MERIIILGAGESGVGAAILAKQKDFDVFVSDFGAIKSIYQDELKSYGIDFEEKQHTEGLILNANLVVKSPGIKEDAPMVLKIKEKAIPVISEIEFAARYCKAKTICITGSNGKTTTTLLIYHILKNAKVNVGLAGNVGKSFARQVALYDFDWYVLELSSFQLDGMFEFKADISILMNITPDHLDRYHYEFQNYVDSKFRILQNQTENEQFIYCADDEVIKNEITKKEIKPKQFPFSLTEIINQGASLDNNTIKMTVSYEDFFMPTDDLAIKGKHNIYNSMASGIAANLVGIRKESIRESLMNFAGVEHRLEFVLRIKGVDYVNDSKATNVNSTWYALESMKTPTVWIVGGIDKGNDYNSLKELVRAKVKAIVCMGIDNSKIHKAFDGMLPLYDTHSMEDAIDLSYRIAKKGDTVLLSPACASFDLFDNYEDRGRKFKLAVQNL